MDISVKENVLKWDPPACEGWKDIEYYTIENGNKSFFLQKSHIPHAKLMQGVHVIVKATNKCHETTIIAVWNPPGQYSSVSN